MTGFRSILSFTGIKSLPVNLVRSNASPFSRLSAARSQPASNRRASGDFVSVFITGCPRVRLHIGANPWTASVTNQVKSVRSGIA